MTARAAHLFAAEIGERLARRGVRLRLGLEAETCAQISRAYRSLASEELISADAASRRGASRSAEPREELRSLVWDLKPHSRRVDTTSHRRSRSRRRKIRTHSAEYLSGKLKYMYKEASLGQRTSTRLASLGFALFPH